MPGQDWSRLGMVIRQHRRRARMSQEDLANAVGMSLRTVGNYERGRTPQTAPTVPDGYYDIARVLGWTPESVDTVLAGGQPTMAGPAERAPSGDEVHELAAPALRLTDMARDMGAPPDLIDRYRLAVIALVGWLANQAAARPDFDLAAYRPHAIGEGVAPDDAERILRALEDDK